MADDVKRSPDGEGSRRSKSPKKSKGKFSRPKDFGPLPVPPSSTTSPLKTDERPKDKEKETDTKSLTIGIDVAVAGGIFLQFPVPARRDIALNVCNTILTGKVDPLSIKSSFDLRVLMECIGQALCLPYEHADVIEKAVEVYRRWLLSDEWQVCEALRQGEECVHEIMRQLSRVFHRDPSRFLISPGNLLNGTQEDLEVNHIRICGFVLSLLREIVAKVSSVFSESSTAQLVKIVVDIVEYVVSANEKSSSLVCCALETFVLCFFELSVVDEQLWSKFRGLFRKLWENVFVVEVWGHLVLALSQQVVEDVAPGIENSFQSFSTEHYSAIEVSPNFSWNIPKMEIDLLYVAWNQVLSLFPYCLEIKNPVGIHLAISKVSAAIKVVLDIFKVQSANSLLDQSQLISVFGPTLLRVANLPSEQYSAAQAAALTGLSFLFFADHAERRHISEGDLAMWYMAILYLLNKEGSRKGDKILEYTLTAGSSMFLFDYSGNHILLPSFVCALTRSLDTEWDADFSSAVIRLLSSIICFPSAFGQHKIDVSGLADYKLVQPILDKTSTPIDTYASLGPPMEKVLRRGLQIPQKDDRTISFMFLSFMSLCETGEKSREFMEFLVSFFFTQLQRSIDNVQNSWDLHGVEAVFVTLTCLADLCKECRALSYISAKIIESLCELIQNSLETTPGSRKNPHVCHAVNVSGFQCLTHWLLVNNCIHSDPKLLQTLLVTIEKGMGKDSTLKRIIVVKEVKFMANYCFSLLLSYIRQNEIRNGGTTLSEYEISQYLPDPVVRTFCKDRTVTSVIGSSVRPDSLVTIIRSPAGTFSWQCHLENISVKQDECQAAAEESASSTEKIEKSDKSSGPTGTPDRSDADSEDDDDLSSFLNELKSTLPENIQNSLNKMESETQTYAQREEESRCVLEKKSSLISPEKSKFKSSDNRSAISSVRFLLSHLNIVNFWAIKESEKPHITRSIMPIAQDVVYVPRTEMAGGASPFLCSLDDSLHHIDSVSFRRCMSIGILFSGVLEQHAIMGSNLMKFLNKLGNPGSDIMALTSGCRRTLSYSDCCNEVTFHLCQEDDKVIGQESSRKSWKPSLSLDSVMFGKMRSTEAMLSPRGCSDASSNPRGLQQKVVVTWMENMSTFDPCSLPDCIVNIQVIPTGQKSFRIRILSRPEVDYHPGPLQSGMVVSMASLVIAIRQTAINYSSIWSKSLYSAYSERETAILEMEENQMDVFPVMLLSSSLLLT